MHPTDAVCGEPRGQWVNRGLIKERLTFTRVSFVIAEKRGITEANTSPSFQALTSAHSTATLFILPVSSLKTYCTPHLPKLTPLGVQTGAGAIRASRRLETLPRPSPTARSTTLVTRDVPYLTATLRASELASTPLEEESSPSLSRRPGERHSSLCCLRCHTDSLLNAQNLHLALEAVGHPRRHHLFGAEPFVLGHSRRSLGQRDLRAFVLQGSTDSLCE